MFKTEADAQRVLETLEAGGVAVATSPNLWQRYPQLPPCPAAPSVDEIRALVNAALDIPPLEVLTGQIEYLLVGIGMGAEYRVYIGVGCVELDRESVPGKSMITVHTAESANRVQRHEFLINMVKAGYAAAGLPVKVFTKGEAN